jgi:predicted RNA-binding Zn-ribbon protein involved in translation (DUF1610 family)
MNLRTLQAAGQITYTNIVCPVCGALLRIGYQALPPDQLMADVQCPVCGTVVAHDAVSVDVLSSPYTALQATGTDWTSMITGMMPMIMMIVMMAVMMPMLKGVTAPTTS